MSSQSEKQLCFGYDKKEQMRCMLCGGKECSKCGLEAYKKVNEPAINLLHSHWITDKIVGMQRPNESSLINGALDDMVNKKITAIFNLTEPGEHPYCGCGTLASSGFPYVPETVMAKGVKHFNFNWPDMTVPSLDMMDRIVSIACNEIQSGGKIAVHCHAGFGRTGLAIACILIANDHLSADSVITFVRNRRPGSIQTAAQQQFIHRYERHRHLTMQIFPTYEEVDENRIGHSKGKAFVAYPKTIAGSVEDQRHFFSQIDQLKSEYRYAHKVVYLASRAISRLSFDHFSVACLAITGLNKLTVKRNSIDAGRDIDNYAARAESVASHPQLLRKKSSFMVATNSLSESSEETMLTEIKLELNQNNYTRMISMADVISADFRAKGESLSKLENKASHQLSVAGSTSLRSLSKRSLNGSQRGLGVRESSFQHTAKDTTRSVNSILARQSSTQKATTTENVSDSLAHSSQQRQKGTEVQQLHEKNHHQIHPNSLQNHRPDKIQSHNQEHKEKSSHNHHHAEKAHPHESHNINHKDTLGKEHHHLHNKSSNHDPNFHHDPHHNLEQHHIERSNSAYNPSVPHSQPHQQQQHSKHTDQLDVAIASIEKQKSSREIPSTPVSLSLRITPLADASSGEDAVDALVMATIAQSHNHHSSQHNHNDREKRPSFSYRERNSSSPSIPKMSLPSPGSLIRGLSAKSINDNSQSNMSGNNTQRSNTSTGSVTSPLTAIRANSLRMNTEQDYAKSKKMAANLLAQLLLDWLETRTDALFTADDVNNLQDIWAQYGGIPKVTDDKLNDESSSRSVSEKVPITTTASAVPVASSPGEIQEDFYEDELIQAVYTLLAQKLSRYKMELLSLLVEMYRFIRLAGFDYTTKLQSASADHSNGHSPLVNRATTMLAGSAESAGSETQALDALVGLRLAIACMHARKKNSNLVRRRGLVIDLVKVFLLKSSSSEYVVINNITFSAENFAQIQHNIGIVLLGQIDVVFRTLNLLVDTQWSSSWKKVRGKHRGQIFDANRVGWRESDNHVRDFGEFPK